jgi:DNA-binding NtrC family response regulator
MRMKGVIVMTDSILLVDDEQGVISALQRALMDESYEIFTANSGADGLNIMKNNRIKLVISDERMPGMSGTECLTSVKNLFPSTIRIMLTGHVNLQAAMNAVNNGEIYRFFAKPWDDLEIKLSIKSAIDKFNLEEENRRLLKTVKRQAGELKQLEMKHPGITSLERDEFGNVILEDLPESDKDISEILTDIISESKYNK